LYTLLFINLFKILSENSSVKSAGGMIYLTSEVSISPPDNLTESMHDISAAKKPQNKLFFAGLDYYLCKNRKNINPITSQ
jgi:hypothetical protein